MANFISAIGNLSGLQLISTTTSTAPIIVNNSNLVANLNVQYLNTQPASYYLSASNITQGGQLGVTYGGTGVSNMANGYVHFGSNNILGQTSNLYWNNSTNQLGIGTSNPTQALDVIIGGLKVSSNSPVSYQGAHLQWNRAGGGGTYLVNQKGSGTGGIFFGESDQSNNFTQTMCLLSNGYLGIGTSTPTVPLNVAGQGLFTDVVKQKKYYFKLYTFSNTAIPNGNSRMTFLNLQNDAINITSTNFTSNLSIFNPPQAGLWSFTSSMWANSLSNTLEFYIVKNSPTVDFSTNNVFQSNFVGSSGMFLTSNTNQFNAISVSGVANLQTTDYICICIWNQNSTVYNFSATDASTTCRCQFQGTLIQPS